MKVVAIMQHNKVLCEVTKEEIALLNGYDYVYSCNKNILEGLTHIGAEFPITKLAAKAQMLRETLPENLKTARESLAKAIEEIEKAEVDLGAMKIFSNLRENS